MAPCCFFEVCGNSESATCHNSFTQCGTFKRRTREQQTKDSQRHRNHRAQLGIIEPYDNLSASYLNALENQFPEVFLRKP